MPTVFRTSRLTASALLALGLFMGLNAWIGARLPILLEDTQTNQYEDLAARVARCAHKERVKVLVLGNSHAVYGLRPPALAAALGLQPDEVFNLAVPAATAFLTRQLLRRHLQAFPNARLALCTVDVLYLADDRRLCERYMTRDAFSERWRYALDHPHDLDSRLGLLLSWPLPAADLGPVLRNSLVTEHTRPLERLVWGRRYHEPPQLASYPWGLPPEPDHFDGSALRWERPWKHQIRLEAADYCQASAGVTAGEADLAANLVDLQAAGVRPVLVRVPLEGSFDRFLRTDPAAAPARTADALLERYLTKLPVPVVRLSDVWWGPHLFRDCDHLNGLGAARFDGRIAQILRATGVLAGALGDGLRHASAQKERAPAGRPVLVGPIDYLKKP